MKHEFLAVFLDQPVHKLLVGLVPRVTVHIACVSPRLKTAEP